MGRLRLTACLVVCLIVAVAIAVSALTLFSMVKIWSGVFWGAAEPL